MSRHPMKLLSLPAVLALVLFSSCEPGGGPGLNAPTGPLFEEAIEDESGANYSLVEGRIPSDILDLNVSKEIGIEGGSLKLAGHTLTVPAGAVDEPTLFTMTLVTNGFVEVDLSATIPGALGNLVDVGERGFNVPVTLSLTYGYASNVEREEEGKLFILRLLGDYESPEHEKIESRVVSEGKTVTVELDHFSKYCLATG